MKSKGKSEQESIKIAIEVVSEDMKEEIKALVQDTLVPLSFYIGAAVYATLFTIWATINAYHHRRLNIGWIIMFALFNVFIV